MKGLEGNRSGWFISATMIIISNVNDDNNTITITVHEFGDARVCTTLT